MPDHPSAPSPNPWLSYAEAGERLGLSAEAVRTKARRAGWRRMPGNDGRTLVQVPEGADEQPPGRSPAHSGLIETLREAVALLGEQLQVERSRADSARAEFEAERSKADAARAEIEAGRARADTDRVEIARLTGELAEKRAFAAATLVELDGHRTRADKAEQTVRAVQEEVGALRQAEEARQARGRWARLRAAWRGE